MLVSLLNSTIQSQKTLCVTLIAFVITKKLKLLQLLKIAVSHKFIHVLVHWRKTKQFDYRPRRLLILKSIYFCTLNMQWLIRLWRIYGHNAMLNFHTSTEYLAHVCLYIMSKTLQEKGILKDLFDVTILWTDIFLINVHIILTSIVTLP